MATNSLRLARVSRADFFLGPKAPATSSSCRKRQGSTPSADGSPPPSQRLRLTEPRTPPAGRQCNWCQRCFSRLSRLAPREVVTCVTLGIAIRCGYCASRNRRAADCRVVCQLPLACYSLTSYRFLVNYKVRPLRWLPSTRDSVLTLGAQLWIMSVQRYDILSTSFLW